MAEFGVSANLLTGEAAPRGQGPPYHVSGSELESRSVPPRKAESRPLHLATVTTGTRLGGRGGGGENVPPTFTDENSLQYACRKTLADSRPRVRGRFAKNDEFGEATKAGSGNHEEDDEEEVGSPSPSPPSPADS